MLKEQVGLLQEKISDLSGQAFHRGGQEGKSGLMRSVLVIQRQARVFLRVHRFKRNLYRLILLKSLIESKLNKEQRAMLLAFEQMIGGEDFEDKDSDDETDKIERLVRLKREFAKE